MEIKTYMCWRGWDADGNWAINDFNLKRMLVDDRLMTATAIGE